jgi:hypothetical protein
MPIGEAARMTWEAGGKLRQKPYVLGKPKDALIPNKRYLLLFYYTGRIQPGSRSISTPIRRRFEVATMGDATRGTPVYVDLNQNGNPIKPARA